MRTIVAAVLLAGFGTGCCKTCDWCRDDAPPARSGSGYATEQPPAESPPVRTTGMPAAPAGTPVGAYGGTGN